MNNQSKLIYSALSDAISRNGNASLIVSGGSSPIPIFNDLSKVDLDWSKVYISLVDDRVVSSDSIHSNENMLNKHLLINNASNANFISLKSEPKKVLEINRPFDVMFLGMGEDGHFASLFPSMIPKANCFNMSAKPEIIYTEPIGRPCYKRVSMNLSLIMESKKIILLVSNEKKAFIVNEAYENKLLPIHFLLTQQRAKIEIVKAY